MIGQALATAVSAVNANALRVNVVADNIANQNTPGFQAGRVRAFSVTTGGAGGRGGGVRAEVFENGPVDVATEFTRLIEAGIAYRAAARALETAAAIAGETVDLIA